GPAALRMLALLEVCLKKILFDNIMASYRMKLSEYRTRPVKKHLGNLKFTVLKKMKEIVHYTPVTLNPITAHPELVLSEDLTSVRLSDERHNLPDDPERFNNTNAVLGSEGFNSGTHCWDVDVGKNGFWILGVMTEGAGRKGDVYSRSGIWYMSYFFGKYYACSTPNPESLLGVKRKRQKIRVTLDWDGGKLTFSDAANNTHLHTLTHTFTERVFPYFFTCCKRSPLRILTTVTTNNCKQINKQTCSWEFSCESPPMRMLN
uniref:B30.2/SPRY domain-containing protein n=1 Tax=Denticeps clupeoides TaxID=299321 RepID=A0AAY4DAU5_9TELE